MRMRILFSTLALAVLGCLAASSVLAAEGGTLKGKFVYAGKAPQPKPLPLSGADAAFCGKPEHKKNLVDESLVVGKDGGLANVFFYMDKKPTAPLHPYYDAKKTEKVVLDNEGCRFVPHALAIWTAQKLAVGNKDTIGHNTNVAGIDGKSFNVVIPAGGTIDESFTVPERLPLIVACNIHPWMKARLLVKDHPYFAISAADGTFEIKHIPAGEYEFKAYHESLLYLKDVTVEGKKVSWPRGTVKIKIEEGKTHDLGVIQVPAAK